MTGSSSQKTMLGIIKALGVRPDLYLSDPKDALNAIKNGKCLGQVKSISGDRLDAATAEVNVTTPLWGRSAGPMLSAKRSRTPYPGSISSRSKPASWRARRNTGCTFIWVGFAATTDMSEEVAYKIVKGMWEGIEEQRIAFKAMKGRDIPKQSIEASSFPLHAEMPSNTTGRSVTRSQTL